LRSLFISAALLIGLASSARADTVTDYVINFTGGVPTPVSGTFTYDSTNPSFSSFLVVWDGVLYDLTASANAPLAGTSNGCLGEGSTPAFAFAIMSQNLSGCSLVSFFWEAGISGPISCPTLTSCQFGLQFDFQAIGLVSTDLIFSSPDVLLPPPPATEPTEAGGTWSIQPLLSTPTPEPSSLLLLSTGLLSLPAVAGLGPFLRLRFTRRCG
jgi:hypothetical protein